GEGCGRFRRPVGYPVDGAGSTRSLPLAGDFNNDGKLDLAVALPEQSAIGFLFGNGDGTFQPATSLAVNGHPSQLFAGDFNRDGKQDLAVAMDMSTFAGLQIFLADATGAFSDPAG